MARKTTAQLFERAMLIRRGKANGLWVPILQALANRGHVWGMLELARWLKANGRTRQAEILCRRAFKLGETNGAQHLAMNRFNANDLGGYRYWLARAAAKGDAQCRSELRRFDTRLSHAAAFEIGRGRPNYPNEGYGNVRRPI